MTHRVKERHTTRQGLILFLLLLGPAPIAFALFVLGEASTTVILLATFALVGTMLELYRRQRVDAKKAKLPVLPRVQVLCLLVILGCISGGTFLLPNETYAQAGFVCLAVAAVLIYGMGVSLRRTLKEPDERCAVLVLALTALLTAFGSAFA